MGRRALAALGGASALALASAAAAARDLEATLLFESDTAWRLLEPRRSQKSQNRVELEAELGLGGGLSLRGLGRVLYDPVARLVGPDPDFGQEPLDRWQVGGSRTVEAELRELHADWTGAVGSARVDLRLGKQQVAWGQSFGLRVLDLVNAQDFREFILDEFEDARTPVWGLRADAFVRGVSLQALLFPDFEPDALPDPESEFGLDPALRGLLPALALSPLGPLVRLDDDEVPPDGPPGSWTYGFRAATRIGRVDAALYGLDRFDPRGVFRRRIGALAGPGGALLPVNEIERDFVRVRTLGFSFATTLGDFALWGEGGLSQGRAYAVDDLADRDGVLRRADLEYALGLDWNGAEHLFANVQWIHQLVLGDADELGVDRSRHYLSLLLRLDFRNETLFPQVFVLYGTNEQEALFRPSLEWRASDRLSLTLGADVFVGPREGLLGQYARRRECVPVPAGLPLPGAGGCLFDPPPGRASRVFLRMRYEFGL